MAIQRKMEIIKLKVMRGPNCWSRVHRQLIVLRIKPDAPAAYPGGVTDELIKKMTSLDIPQQLLRKGQAIPDLVGLIAVALQRLSGMDCPYFSEQHVGIEGCSEIVFPYEVEDAGVY